MLKNQKEAHATDDCLAPTPILFSPTLQAGKKGLNRSNVYGTRISGDIGVTSRDKN
jgi:hypothetical protein